MKSLFWKKIDIKPRLTNAPKTEEGLSLTYMIDKNKYIHFGGFSSSTSAEPKEGDKEIGSPMSSPMKSPSRTTMTTLKSPTSPSGSSLLFSQSKPKLAECSVVYIFDPVDNSWTVQKCKDKLPPKRLFHHSWYEAPNFFVYGGISSDKKILFDIYVLNTDTWTWRKFFSLDGPLARLHSAFIDLGPKKYLVGGASYPENLVLNDIWSLSFDNVAWKSQFDIPGLAWEKLELKEGQLPNIKAHAAIRLTDTLMFIFGGYDQKGECTATSLLLDTERLRVIPFETKGKKPGPRAFHKMIAVKENIICLFGGVSSHEDNFKTNTPWLLNEFYLLNISEGYWSNPNVGGYIPSARCYFAMSTNENEYYNQILVLGGKTFEKEEESMYILSELTNDDSDAWGVVYDKDKEKEREFVLQMTSNRFGIPSSAKKMEVTRSTVEINQAEKMMVEQKKQIGELEAIVKNFKETNGGLEQRRNELKKRLTDLKKTYDEEIKVLETTKEEKTKRNNQNNELNDRLKVLLAFEKKKRKLAEIKSLALQASMRKSENFIITIDSFYNKCLKDNLLTGMIKEDILNKIELHKTQHKETLMKFKDEYEHIFTEEKSSRTELKAKKKMLKQQQIDLSGAYKAILTKDEEKYFSVTKKT